MNVDTGAFYMTPEEVQAAVERGEPIVGAKTIEELNEMHAKRKVMIDNMFPFESRLSPADYTSVLESKMAVRLSESETE